MRSFVVLLILVLMAGCRPVDDHSTGTGQTTHEITTGGVTRSFRLYVPAAGLARPAPLVVMLHGGFGTAEQAEGAYGWDAEADRSGFVVAYPDGLGRAWNVGGGCCGRPGRDGTDDVAFIEAVVASVSSTMGIDPRRVYATGMSNGAMLAYRLACDSTVFAAIAPVAGTLLGSCDQPAPISVLHIHGLADQNVPFDGSPGHGVATVDGPPIPTVIALWRRVDSCEKPVESTNDTVVTSRTTCSEGRSVDLVTVGGAGHQWPGSRPKTVGEKVIGLDTPSNAFDATDLIWQFFVAHPR